MPSTFLFYKEDETIMNNYLNKVFDSIAESDFNPDIVKLGLLDTAKHERIKCSLAGGLVVCGLLMSIKLIKSIVDYTN